MSTSLILFVCIPCCLLALCSGAALWFLRRKLGPSCWLVLLDTLPLGPTVLLYLLALLDWRSDRSHPKGI